MHTKPDPQAYSTTSSYGPKRRLWLGCATFAFSFSLIFTGLGVFSTKFQDVQKFVQQNWRHWSNEVLTFAARANDDVSDLPLAVPSPHMALQQFTAVPEEILPPHPAMTAKERLKSLYPHDALKDPLERISKDFHIPKGLEKRTQFWFDIYTKHDSYTHVIHHTRYPWVVYKIIDTRPMIENGKGALWLRRQKAENHVKAERRRIQKILKRLAYKKSYRKLSKEEREIYKLTKVLSGKRSKVFKMAYRNIRSQLGQKDFFIQGLRRSSRYLPYMEEEFAAQGVPIELTRMPFVESSFNENAVSKVGASGIWQIMPRTGRAYMKVEKYLDERNSPLKATRVAGKLLRQYYRSLDSWPLAVTSYNHGIGNIRKAIRAARSRDLVTIIDRYHRGDFKFASSNFYTCFLAALHAEKYHDVLFPHVARERLIEREVFTLTTNMRLNTLAKKLNLTRSELTAYNQDLKAAGKRNILLRKGYKLHLPPGEGAVLLPKYGVQEKRPDRRA